MKNKDDNEFVSASMYPYWGTQQNGKERVHQNGRKKMCKDKWCIDKACQDKMVQRNKAQRQISAKANAKLFC